MSAHLAWACFLVPVRAHPALAWRRESASALLEPASRRAQGSIAAVPSTVWDRAELRLLQEVFRMSKLTMAMVALVTMNWIGMARANGPAGDACAAKLTVDGKAIYTATLAAKPTTETLRATLEKEARALSWVARLPAAARARTLPPQASA
jgi:hypothetical protein